MYLPDIGQYAYATHGGIFGSTSNARFVIGTSLKEPARQPERRLSDRLWYVVVG